MSVFLERLSMWNMLNCAEQVQTQKGMRLASKEKMTKISGIWWASSTNDLYLKYECGTVSFIQKQGGGGGGAGGDPDTYYNPQGSFITYR